MIRRVLRGDALFELILGAYLIVAVALWPDGVRMADPVSSTILVAVAVALAAAGVVIWWLSARPARITVMALIAANVVGAALFLAWLAVADGFSGPAAGLLTATSGALAVLALVEFAGLSEAESASPPA